MEKKLDLRQPAKKAAVSSGVAVGGYGFAILVVLIAKHVFKQEISLEVGLAIAGGIGTGITGIGRGVESVIKWWFKTRKLIVELKNDVGELK